MRTMLRYYRQTVAALLLIVVIFSASPLPVRAIADPDSPLQVNNVYVYEGLLESGDVGVLIDYYIDYAVLPTETATEAYLGVFVDTDGTTQLKSAAPYTFVDSGYGRGLVWIYFTAAEATAASLTSASSALYRVWMTGNPTVPSGWAGDPPKTIASISTWHTTGDPNVLLALRVLYYADVLELIWSLDLVEATALGSKLTTTLGESYFTNVIANLRTMAPNAFSSAERDPTYNPISYDTTFGATATSGTATIVGSPVTLIPGNNTIDTGATTGTIVIDLAGWTFGTVTNNTGIVTGSPVTINPGVNTLTVTGAGTFTVAVDVVDTITLLDDSATGTAFDLTALSTAFGMSRWMISGLIWMLVTILVCAAVYRVEQTSSNLGVDSTGGSKVITLVFTLTVIGGALLGLLHPLVAALLFIGSGALIGYVFFFRSETLHKGFMFMAWMFVIVSLAGNVLAGSNNLVATRLTADVATGTINSISVASTTGFGSSGIIVIGDEEIGYPSKTTTLFQRSSVAGVTTNPILRGANGTTDAAHTTGDIVRTREASVLNASIDYKIAQIADTAGIMGFLTFPAKLLDLIMTFFILPLDFLGTDLAILSYIWMVIAVGMLVGFVTALAGGRRV